MFVVIFVVVEIFDISWYDQNSTISIRHNPNSNKQTDSIDYISMAWLCNQLDFPYEIYSEMVAWRENPEFQLVAMYYYITHITRY